MGEHSISVNGQITLPSNLPKAEFLSDGGIIELANETTLSNVTLESSVSNQSNPDFYFDFENGSTQGWTETSLNQLTSSSSSPYNGSYSLMMREYASSSGYAYSPIHTTTLPGRYFLTYALRAANMDRECYYRLEYSINGNDWQQLYESIRDWTFGWTKFQFPIEIEEGGSTVQFRFYQYVQNNSNGCYNENTLFLDDFSFDLETEWALASTWSPTAGENLSDYNADQVFVTTIGDVSAVDVYFLYDRDGDNNFPFYDVGPFSTSATNTTIRVRHQNLRGEYGSNDILFQYRAIDSQGWSTFYNSPDRECEDRIQAYDMTDMYFDLTLDPTKQYFVRFYSQGHNDPNNDYDECWQRIEKVDFFNPISLSDKRLPLIQSSGDLTVLESTIGGKISALNSSVHFSSENSVLDEVFIAADSATASIANSTIVPSDGNPALRMTTNHLEVDISNSEFTSAAQCFSARATSGNIALDSCSFEVQGFGTAGYFQLGNSHVSIKKSNFNGGLFGLLGIGTNSDFDLEHTIFQDASIGAIQLSGNSELEIRSSIITNNGFGIRNGGSSSFDHCTIAFNSQGPGISTSGNFFNIITNSILWGNNSIGFSQIENSAGVTTIAYSDCQGFGEYGNVGAGVYSEGQGVINLDPLFADDSLHLNIYSPCVDAGEPWSEDAHMPSGLGGVRADMGAYGGALNPYWGGQPVLDGACEISSISDSPQDNGNVVGIAFSASVFDNSELTNNVTSYAFWRHYDPTGQSIGTLDEGNWELIGEMPAQSFNGYAYQAQTLGNTNSFGTFNSCYTVVAQTDDPDTYWYSNVLCGESVDNLAPMEPELAGLVLETGDVTVFWELPEEEDYAYTEVVSDAGFMTEVTGDTLAVDLSTEFGGTYTYTAVHYDVNGNASTPASVTLSVAAGSDIVTLNAGWNLISTDREETLDLQEVFASLTPGNLQYVTGFDGSVQFYDPDGLPFLNTLNALTPGKGYWVKVAADDVLDINGTRLDEGYMPALVEGWNLIGYAPEAPQAPGTFFAELEADGDLLYVTGFDQGAQLYNPNGLTFLNTLSEMRNGYGYWVKSAAATEAGVFSPLAEDALLAEQPTPVYDVVNGVSELKAYAGEFVDVLNGWGVTVARLPILEGGHLMTTALFGDDPSTAAIEGLVAGETLHFAFRGAMANETLVFGGDMAHKTLSLTFNEVEAAMGVFPNPASDVATFRFHVDMDAQVEVALIDLTGRQVAVLLDANKGRGAHAETLTLSTLEAGTYTVQLKVAGEVTCTQRLVITH